MLIHTDGTLAVELVIVIPFTFGEGFVALFTFVKRLNFSTFIFYVKREKKNSKLYFLINFHFFYLPCQVQGLARENLRWTLEEMVPF